MDATPNSTGLEITATAGPLTATLTVADHETDAESGLVSPRWIAYVAGSSLVGAEQTLAYNADDGLDSWTSEDESEHEALEAAIRIAIVDAHAALRAEQRETRARVRRTYGATCHAALPVEMRDYLDRLEWDVRDLEWIEPSARQIASDRDGFAAVEMACAAE